jgi:hypothetical protein
MKLNILNEIPEGLYNCPLSEIHNILKGPTIIDLSKGKKDTLFISSLLHGNETTSFLALQKIFTEYKDKEYPRGLVIFIGNTLSASTGQRHLPDQPDYNRIWEEGSSPEHLMSREVLTYASDLNLFACLDIHNNSGKNPFYGCINIIDKRWIELASYFSNQIVYFTEPSEVLSNAFAKLCPSVTIEAGLPGEEEGIEAVYKYIDKVLHLESFNPEFDQFEADVYHTIGRIKINKDARLDFFDKMSAESDISFIDTIDEKNFELVKKNTHFGHAENLEMISAINNDNMDITDDIFCIIDGQLQSNRMFIPAMFTKDIYIMKEDCMGYIMEKMIPLKC